ncbi:DNA-binding response regulator [Amylibacter kogurei]|uniref:DNA-binding response regulator n=1 Tax=Paramylibacter kogurei TaxID=1889778 RepID=A0A2G5K500_9RHOB|nr:response regulator transcription factor [Amylibacter kogurei]PIB24611.1 DNA-binding response regulator [Amylibacter kogurei]
MTESATEQLQIDLNSALIVDDHPLFCDALSLIVQMVSDIETPDTAASLQDALDKLDAGLTPDIVLLDLSLPDVNGLDGLMRIRARNEKLIIVVVSSMSDNQMIRSTIAAGANGFIPKHSPKEVFKQAFETLRSGKTYLPPEFVESPNAETDKDSPQIVIDRLATLTRQQGRILRLMSDGKLNKQIAYELSIAEATVKAHITAILRKLNAQNRTQAVLLLQQAKFQNLAQMQTDVNTH